MNNYSKLGSFRSRGRLIKEPNNKFRTPFQRDRDRIIHSASFRRLKHKTQVFVNTDGDHYRTRILTQWRLLKLLDQYQDISI